MINGLSWGKVFLTLQQRIYSIIVCLLFLMMIDNQGSFTNMTYPFSFNTLSHESIKSIAPQYVQAVDGLNLAYYAFLPKNPQALLIFYHGGGAYSNKLYQTMASILSQHHTIGVYLVDIRGHGKSEGPRGDAPFVEQVWQDISTIIRIARTNHPLVPLYLGGHSSGAGLILNYATWKERRTDIAGYILLAPYLGPNSYSAKQHTTKGKHFIKKIRKWVYILHGITGYGGHIPTVFFNYPQTIIQNDPLMVPFYSCIMSQATSIINPQETFAQLEKPFGIFIGTDDEQFIPEKILAYYSHASLIKHQSSRMIINGATHLSIVPKSPSMIAQVIETINLARG